MSAGASVTIRVPGLIEPPRPPNLTPQRERLRELDLDLRPRLSAPALVQHRAEDAVDAEPGVPEALVVSFTSPAVGARPRLGYGAQITVVHWVRVSITCVERVQPLVVGTVQV